MLGLIDRIADKLHELTLRNGGQSRGASDMREDAVALLRVMAGGGVVWRQISDLPYAAYADGSEMLLWTGEEAGIGYWSDSGPQVGWLDRDGGPVAPTHCAGISPPER